MVLGVVLIALALVLAVRAVLSTPASGSAPAPPGRTIASAGRTPSSPASALAPVDPASPGAAAAAGTGSGQVTVHVAGAVNSPGVVTLPAGSRVVDAITAAGGAAADADTDQLNLARQVTDGEQVRVPRIGQDASAWQTPPGPPASPAAGASGGPTGQESVNINTASAAELEALPGIGPALAQRIVDHRQQHGPFASVDDLLDVPGIGRAKLEALKGAATV